MAITCPRCGAAFDVTLFQFGHTVQCDCGHLVELSEGHVIEQETQGHGPESESEAEPDDGPDSHEIG
jgi:hypothetical protein